MTKAIVREVEVVEEPVPEEQDVTTADLADLPTDYDSLIELARASEFAATRNLAENASRAVQKLRDRLTLEESTRGQREQARTVEQQLREVQASVAALKAQRAQLRGTSARSGRDGQIRAWARSQNIAVPDRGRVPADVVAAYEAVAND